MIKTVIKIAFLILWLGAGLSFLAKQNVEINKAELSNPDGGVEKIDIPYVNPTEKNGFYTFDIKFNAGLFPTKAFQIWIDDCLEDIKLNGNALSHIGRRCLDQNGIIVDFSKHYQRGENHLQIKVKENGGKLKLSFKPYANSNAVQFLKLVYVFGIALIWFSISKSFPKQRTVINLLLLALVFRAVFIFQLHPLENYIFSDMAGHERKAKEILEGIPDTKNIEKPPGYHYLVTLSLLAFDNYEGIKYLHLIASVMTCLLVAKASRRFLGRSGANIILAMLAVHIPLIFINGILMEESLFALCIAWLFLLLTKHASYFKNGIVFGLAFCLKGTHVFFLPLAVFWQLLRKEQKFEKIFKNWLGFALGLSLIIAVQLLITKKIYGTAKFPSAGAVNFIEGKCEGDSQTDINGSYRYSPLFSQIGRERVRAWPFSFQESDKVWLAGLDCIKQNPYVLISSLSSVYYLFHGNLHWPFNQTRFYDLNEWYGMIFSFFVFPGICLGVLRLAKSPKHILPFLPAFSLLICVWFFKSEIRFRIPFDAIFIPLSALGWASTIKLFFPKNHRKILSIASYCYILIVASSMSLSFLDYLIR